MSDFFDKNLLQGIVTGAFFLLLSVWLTSKGSPGSTGKRWKISVILGNAMILGGLYMLARHYPNGHFNNPLAGMGLSIFALGIPVKYFGKFMVWWHR